MSRKFLIGQLAYFGDCLYATTVAKQIKSDFPDSHVTWAIASKYKSILLLNPYVDKIWEIEIVNNDYFGNGWKAFEAEAKRRQAIGEYDEVFFTQIQPNWKNYDGTIRSSILNNYPGPITVPVNPIIHLNTDEIERVRIFSEKYKLANYKKKILFECSPGSGQSFVDFPFSLTVAEAIVARFNDVCIILSSPYPLNHHNPQILDASELTYRENAELIKYCTLLIGCSSGITWLSTSDWVKKIDTLQLLNRDNVIYSGIKYDFELWNIPTSNVIEVTINNVDYVVDCVSDILQKDFTIAKKRFDEVYKPSYLNFREVLRFVLLSNGTNKSKKLIGTIFGHAKRNPHFNVVILLYLSLIEISNFYLKKFFVFIRRKRDLKKT
jgi:hypothetical protein